MERHYYSHTRDWANITFIPSYTKIDQYCHSKVTFIPSCTKIDQYCHSKVTFIPSCTKIDQYCHSKVTFIPSCTKIDQYCHSKVTFIPSCTKIDQYCHSRRQGSRRQNITPKYDVVFVWYVEIMQLGSLEGRIHFAMQRSRQGTERADETQAPSASSYCLIHGPRLGNKRVAVLQLEHLSVSVKLPHNNI